MSQLDLSQVQEEVQEQPQPQAGQQIPASWPKIMAYLNPANHQVGLWSESIEGASMANMLLAEARDYVRHTMEMDREDARAKKAFERAQAQALAQQLANKQLHS